MLKENFKTSTPAAVSAQKTTQQLLSWMSFSANKSATAKLISYDDDVLCKFWEIEENPREPLALTLEERSVVRHFQETHRRNDSGRFVVPLPKKPQSKPLGESRCQAGRRFRSLKCTLHTKNQFSDFLCSNATWNTLK